MKCCGCYLFRWSGLSQTVCTGCYYAPNAFHHEAYLFSNMAMFCDKMCMLSSVLCSVAFMYTMIDSCKYNAVQYTHSLTHNTYCAQYICTIHMHMHMCTIHNPVTTHCCHGPLHSAKDSPNLNSNIYSSRELFCVNS